MLTFFSLTDHAAAPFLRSRQTRNRVSEVDRAHLVQWYVAQVGAGDRNPAGTLADRYPESSYKTWANVFSRARTQLPALLTDPPRRGVAGGMLTDHAERLLGFSSAVPDDIRDMYGVERVVYPAPVRHERRTAPPGRSKFASDTDYDRAYEAWAAHGQWFVPHEVGAPEVEDIEDWWNGGQR